MFKKSKQYHIIFQFTLGNSDMWTKYYIFIDEASDEYR